MRILVIDTAFEFCQVGLWQDGVCVETKISASGGKHDHVLATMVQEIFAAQNITVQNIDRIFVTTGPGRFTGLRVGIAFARGLALVNDTKMVGVLTTDALRWQMEQAGLNAAAMATIVTVKRGESFVQYFHPTEMPIEKVMDDGFEAFFQSGNTAVAGVVSPEVFELISKIPELTFVAGIDHPSLDAIYAVGARQTDSESPLIRPYYVS